MDKADGRNKGGNGRIWRVGRDEEADDDNKDIITFVVAVEANVLAIVEAMKRATAGLEERGWKRKEVES